MNLRFYLTVALASFAATVAWNFTGTLFTESRTVWQYDGWRAQYRAEQIRKAEEAKRQAWLEAEFQRTNKVDWSKMGWSTNNCIVMSGSWTSVTNGFAYGYYAAANPARGTTEYPPTFQVGDLEMGYRRDGTVVWRSPPELHGFKGFAALVQDVKRMGINAWTNILGTNY